jgi:hypothetical protein
MVLQLRNRIGNSYYRNSHLTNLRPDMADHVGKSLDYVAEGVNWKMDSSGNDLDLSLGAAKIGCIRKTLVGQEGTLLDKDYYYVNRVREENEVTPRRYCTLN